jgi:hypothetical protein
VCVRVCLYEGVCLSYPEIEYITMRMLIMVMMMNIVVVIMDTIII